MASRVASSATTAPVSDAEAVDVDALVVDGRDDGEAVLLAEREVLLAAARRDVDDAGALLVGDLVPRDDAVLDALLRRQLVERAAVRQADQLACPATSPIDLVLAA